MSAGTDAPGRGRVIGLAAFAALLVALLGGLATDIGPWYQALEKPSWQPPDYLFGPVWTLIYSLTTIAVVLTWWARPDRTERKRLLIWVSYNVFFNILWSVMFFRLQRPDWALIEVAFLWVSILILAIFCWRRRPLAGWLLLPYLAWVSFAAVLNFAVVRLNTPFGG